MKSQIQYISKRAKLVSSLQLKGISDPNVLEAVGSVPRELFIDEDLRDRAYEDTALPLANGQTISQPYTVAYMTELLSVKAGDRILEIGAGSGYQSCILHSMGAKVFAVERIPELLERAKKMFQILNIHVETKLGDGTKGWSQRAPFDGIIVTAAAPKAPESLKTQLAVGGRLVVPVGDRSTQVMLLLKRTSQSEFSETRTDRFRFVPLIGEEGWEN